jgi:hypothetical protein
MPTRARQQLEAFVAERGLTIAAWYLENESGAKLARPELLRDLVEGALRGRRHLWRGARQVFDTARQDSERENRLRGGVFSARSPLIIMGFLVGSAFLSASLTVVLAWLWLRDLELALLLAPTGGMLVVFVALVVTIFVAPRSAPPRSGLSSRA